MIQMKYNYNENTKQIQKSHYRRDRSVISAPQLSFLALSLWSYFPTIDCHKRIMKIVKDYLKSFIRNPPHH